MIDEKEQAVLDALDTAAANLGQVALLVREQFEKEAVVKNDPVAQLDKLRDLLVKKTVTAPQEVPTPELVPGTIEYEYEGEPVSWDVDTAKAYADAVQADEERQENPNYERITFFQRHARRLANGKIAPPQE